ncbi:AMIN-like domain-containing (lipo)protein [Dactylosporangium sp. CA-052675]|uniref:AMIN-like domain-containing (lipo)protein n=1 Tax=Dactylosporangium sp. CA-052675 TaxID=3239927 RepID=UPI003D8E2CC7
MRRSLLAAAVCAGLVVALPVAARAADLPAPTSTSAVAGDPSGSGRPVLTGIRTGRHDEYDRTVFDFTGGTPGWRVAYAPLVEQGRGNTIPVAGAATLLVVFDGAGTPAVDLASVYEVNLPTLRQIRSGGYFEGRASFGLGVRDRVGLRVLVLHGPDRIAVDVAHQPADPFTADPFAADPFAAEPFARTGDASGTVVRAVGAGGHPGYDRIVFDVTS